MLENKNVAGADAVMVVTIPESLQLTRLMQRNNLTEKEAQSRISAQMPLVEKEKLADLILEHYTGVEKKYFSKSMGSVDNKSLKEKDDNMLREFLNLSLEQLDGEYIRNWLSEEYMKSNFNKKSSLCA